MKEIETKSKSTFAISDECFVSVYEPTGIVEKEIIHVFKPNSRSCQCGKITGMNFTYTSLPCNGYYIEKLNIINK